MTLRRTRRNDVDQQERGERESTIDDIGSNIGDFKFILELLQILLQFFQKYLVRPIF